MRKLPLLLPCLIALCGFIPAPFDADAVPKASAARKQAIGACSARSDFKSTAEVIDCVVVADSAFAHAIRLGNSGILNAYLTEVKALDAGIVAGSIKPDEVTKNFRSLQDRFFKAMNDQYADYQADLEQDFADSQARPAAGMTNGMNTTGSMGNIGNMGATTGN